MVTMVKNVQMTASVRMKLCVISELGHVTVQLDGWDNSATQVKKDVLLMYSWLIISSLYRLSEWDIRTELPASMHVLT